MLFNTEKVNSAIYELMMKFHQKEFNIFNILSLAPSGLTLFDLIRITNIHCEGLDFGNWSDFLTKFFSSEKLERSETKSSFSSNEPALTKSQTLQMRKHDSKNITNKIMEGSKYSDLSSKIKEFQIKHNIYIIKKKKLMDTDMDYFEIQRPFSEFIRSKMDL